MGFAAPPLPHPIPQAIVRVEFQLGVEQGQSGGSIVIVW